MNAIQIQYKKIGLNYVHIRTYAPCFLDFSLRLVSGLHSFVDLIVFREKILQSCTTKWINLTHTKRKHVLTYALFKIFSLRSALL